MTDLEGATCVCGTWQDMDPGGREHKACSEDIILNPSEENANHKVKNIASTG